MSDGDGEQIQQIIQELKELQVRETNLLQEIEEINAYQNSRCEQTNRARINTGIPQRQPCLCY